jgi:hypothetical protein
MLSKCLQVQDNRFWQNISAPKTLLIAIFSILVGSFGPLLYLYFSCLSQIPFYPYVLASLIPEKRNRYMVTVVC